jgi:hypothetical protein
VRDPRKYVSPSPHLKTEIDPVFKTLCLLVFPFGILGDGQSSLNPVNLSVRHHRQNPLDATEIYNFQISTGEFCFCGGKYLRRYTELIQLLPHYHMSPIYEKLCTENCSF